ncbi:PREDICTED: uncharacterized protein LOC109165761 [Ipomoea nil]|uniref:uncharacterized protein LOC109165761 n=1 Tax=Ipomoea nil TaxID=35883 RepID=UPI0009014036|nr:PREDICTED: uncharacterized protein LOC109165761 [Ipomoea nil]
MEEAAKLLCSGGGYGDLAAEGEGKCSVVIAAISSAAAEINNGDSSGEGEADYHHRNGGGDSDYRRPRKLRKYRSIAAIYQSTKPSEITINTTAKRRRGKNNGKKAAKRTMKAAAADDEEVGNKAAAAVSTGGGDSNFIEVESLEEAAEMEEACRRRKPKFRSILELYEILN